MKLLAVGGGSGGHVTPVLAVVNELSIRDSHLEVLFVCDRAFESQSRGLMSHARVPVAVQTIRAGKLRRYRGESLLQRLSDVRTIVWNIRDIAWICVGFVQSLWLVMRYRPDVVFAKGGYVCLPIGIAAWLLRFPVVIHDSDTRPGLTNRVLARLASRIATGSPLENYPYPPSISEYVGVPIDPAFHPMAQDEKTAARHAIGVVDVAAPLVVVTGGGLGAKSINDAMVRDGQSVIDHGVQVFHISGKRHYDTVSAAVSEHPHYQVVPFVYQDMAQVLGAADVVVARGSATFLQELAGLGTPTIVVPAQHLSDQVKNAAAYQEADAVAVLSDAEIAQPGVLGRRIVEIMKDTAYRHKLSRNIQRFARPHAARDMAQIIYGVAIKRRGGNA